MNAVQRPRRANAATADLRLLLSAITCAAILGGWAAFAAAESEQEGVIAAAPLSPAAAATAPQAQLAPAAPFAARGGVAQPRSLRSISAPPRPLARTRSSR